MKYITLIILILAIGSQAFGQQNSDQRFYYLGKAEKYKKMQGTGIGLTVAGGVLFIVGCALAADVTITETTDSYGYSTIETSGHPGLAVGSLLLGAGSLGAGIPLMIIGGKKNRKYSNMAESVSLKINANPQRTGVSLVYRF